MTIIYNKNTPDYYLVAGLGEEDSLERSYGYKTRNLSGDFIVISSDQRTSGTKVSRLTKSWRIAKKMLLVLLLISAIPFSAVLSTGYIRLMINGEMG